MMALTSSGRAHRVASRIFASGVTDEPGSEVRKGNAAISYWAATTSKFDRGSSLTGDVETDVAIIGAGFTGLSVAYHLKQAGRDCVVLDAHEPGWGASGRNGGIAVPRFKKTYPELAKKYGEDIAIGLYRVAHDAVDTLEQVIAQNDIACGFARHGHITPVVFEADIKRFEQDVRWLGRTIGDTTPEMLGSQEVLRRTGSSFYKDGYFEPRGGGIHPLAYCRGLASALVRQGVPIICNTPILSWRSDSSAVVLEGVCGRVKARALVIATNGYTDLSEAGELLKRRIVPVVSSIIATEPLPEKILNELLPGRNVVTDAKRLTNYFRLIGGSRMLFGGRGGASNRESPKIYKRLARDMVAIFPQLRGIRCDYTWSGRVAVTLDSLPHLGRIDRNVHYAIGYNGRGVALACYLGKMLARAVCGESAELGPICSNPFKEIPFYALRTPAKRIAITCYRILDRLK